MSSMNIVTIIFTTVNLFLIIIILYFLFYINCSCFCIIGLKKGNNKLVLETGKMKSLNGVLIFTKNLKKI
ncbi:hypothetical protein CE561_03710 [Thermoanaerobacterium thermosaccharolyticum]|uniref:Uncharacterized protein n=1 Tax=Thermoanaerobacterium thermosaccharolyticum TaxID=1517 RepID=A0A231VLC6_THETR|nr:hypothetical protein CE561_03710 [Thermoanaerobacterium thermosaccharolyticum]